MMKHNPSNRRSRNRSGGGGGGKRPGGGGGRNNFESNGPEVKVRGTAQQVLEKYLTLARDAASAGDRIKSESYFQFAEHYYRIANADGSMANANQNRREAPLSEADAAEDAADDANGGANRGANGDANRGASGGGTSANADGPQPDVKRSSPRPPREAPPAQVAAEKTVVADNATDKAADKTVAASETAATEPAEAAGADKIDESVLPAAVPTAPRRRRSRSKPEPTGEAESADEPKTEPEAVQV